ncbi:MAG: cytochrome c [Hyphomicrobiaceae bacterium]|nr:cytochrome c [Hyphomicrobiaceae bacterium]
MRLKLIITLPIAMVLAFGAGTDLRANEPPKAADAPAAAGAAPENGGAKPVAEAAAAAPAAGAARTLADALKAEKGTLKNPFTDNPEAIAEGKKIYFNYSCNGCHGGGGGGGMCPPLTNEVWIYGSDDDTMFRLIAMGTKDLQALGYTRKRTESVKGPMPGYLEIIDTEEELWKIIAFIRTVYAGRPEKRDW